MTEKVAISMHDMKYLVGYPEAVAGQVAQLIAQDKLGAFLKGKYPVAHGITTDKALYDFTVELKNRHLRKAAPLSKVVYDSKINILHQALGTHTFVSRVQGAKLKAKHEIRIGMVFKQVPLAFLQMIVVHELAHMKEKDHNKAFYSLCEYMEPDYHQLEFDMRLYLTQLEVFGSLY